MTAQVDRAYLRASPAKALGRLLAATLFEGRPLTSRARALNPLVRAVHSAAPRLAGTTLARPPLYVIGTGRSGTTWLAKVLSLHPDVALLNEPKALWHAAIPDEDLVGSYARGPARLALTAEDATPAARARLAASYALFLRLSRAHTLLDKYPELVFRVACVRALFPGARFLWLVRRGADTCASVASWSHGHAVQSSGERHDWWGADGRKHALLVEQGAAREPDLAPHLAELAALQDDAARAALEWTLAMRAGLAASARFPGELLRIDYEALCAAPTRAVERALSFAGLAPSARVLRYAEAVAERRGGAVAPSLPPALAAAFARTQAELDARA